MNNCSNFYSGLSGKSNNRTLEKRLDFDQLLPHDLAHKSFPRKTTFEHLYNCISKYNIKKNDRADSK